MAPPPAVSDRKRLDRQRPPRIEPEADARGQTNVSPRTARRESGVGAAWTRNARDPCSRSARRLVASSTPGPRARSDSTRKTSRSRATRPSPIPQLLPRAGTGGLADDHPLRAGGRTTAQQVQLESVHRDRRLLRRWSELRAHGELPVEPAAEQPAPGPRYERVGIELVELDVELIPAIGQQKGLERSALPRQLRVSRQGRERAVQRDPQSRIQPCQVFADRCPGRAALERLPELCPASVDLHAGACASLFGAKDVQEHSLAGEDRLRRPALLNFEQKVLWRAVHDGDPGDPNRGRMAPPESTGGLRGRHATARPAWRRRRARRT